MEKYSKKFAFLFAAFTIGLLPAFASAQLPMPNPGELLTLSANDPRCSEGHACFMVGVYRPGGVVRSFERMLEVVNRGRAEGQHVTLEQLDAANECGVMYVRGTGDARVFGANGACSRNGTIGRMTFDAFCRGDRSCQRWPYANRVYRVPSVRILTPDERAEEMAREIRASGDTATVPAPADMGQRLTELSELMSESRPPTAEHVRDVIAAMGAALTNARTATGTASAEPAAVPADMDFSAEASDANSEMNATDASRIAELEQELAAARAASEGRWPWWVTILVLFIGAVLSGGSVILVVREQGSARRIREFEDASSNEAIVPQAVPDDDLVRERDTLDAIVAAIQKIYFDATSEKVDLRTSDGQQALKKRIAPRAQTVMDRVEIPSMRIRDAYEKLSGLTYTSADQVAQYLEMWVEPLRGLSPEQLKKEREQAKLFRMMREEWATTPRLGLQFTVENLAMMVGTWLRFDALQKAWAKLEPAFVPDYALTDGGLQAYLDDHVERQIEAVRLDEAEKCRDLVAQLEKQRDEFARRLEEERGKNVASAVDADDIKRRTLALVNERVGTPLDELRREFAAITTGDPGREAVDADLIRSAFSLGRRKMAPFYAFMQGIFDRTTAARKELDTLLAPRETDEVVRESGRIHTPPRPSFAAIAPPPAADGHPDLFGDQGLDELEETAEATPIEGEKTRIVPNPLLEAKQTDELRPESTNPFAEHPDFAGGGNNGVLRGDEPTVPTKNGGRERRDTHRGFPVAASPSVPDPIAVPLLVPPEGSSDGE